MLQTSKARVRGYCWAYFFLRRPVSMDLAIKLLSFAETSSTILRGSPWPDIVPPPHRRVLLAPAAAKITHRADTLS